MVNSNVPWSIGVPNAKLGMLKSFWECLLEWLRVDVCGCWGELGFGCGRSWLQGCCGCWVAVVVSRTLHVRVELCVSV